MMPELRRVRRLTEANRSDTCPVRLFDFDSFHGFNGKHLPMGTLDIPYELCENIKNALADKRS